LAGDPFDLPSGKDLTIEAGANAPGGIARPPPPPATSLLDATELGGVFGRPCKLALSRLGERLAIDGSPERAAATTWLNAHVNGKGWRAPTLSALGGTYLSEEVVARPTGERVTQIREEFVRPVLGRDGTLVASRISVVDVDCAGRRARVVGLFEYAANGAQQLVKENRDYNARWLPVDAGFTFSRHFNAICEAEAVKAS
jgi:hypothetical protein